MQASEGLSGRWRGERSDPERSERPTRSGPERVLSMVVQWTRVPSAVPLQGS